MNPRNIPKPNHISALERFAQSQPLVIALYEGVSPEDSKHKIYYFLFKGPYNTSLENDLTDLSLLISQHIKTPFDLSSWPYEPNSENHYPFLGRRIWKRD